MLHKDESVVLFLVVKGFSCFPSTRMERENILTNLWNSEVSCLVSLTDIPYKIHFESNPFCVRSGSSRYGGWHVVGVVFSLLPPPVP